jgi:hypothetical protein
LELFESPPPPDSVGAKPALVASAGIVLGDHYFAAFPIDPGLPEVLNFPDPEAETTRHEDDEAGLEPTIVIVNLEGAHVQVIVPVYCESISPRWASVSWRHTPVYQFHT